MRMPLRRANSRNLFKYLFQRRFFHYGMLNNKFSQIRLYEISLHFSISFVPPFHWSAKPFYMLRMSAVIRAHKIVGMLNPNFFEACFFKFRFIATSTSRKYNGPRSDVGLNTS